LDRLRSPGLAALGGAGARLRDGYAVGLGRAAVRFLSAAPGANARGQTADLLLVANEAQDIDPAVWDAVFDPMAAATNATTVFSGTVWSRETLLARQLAFLEAQEAADGVRRVWRIPWETVAAEIPAYGERVRARISQFGLDHPFIQTEYCLRELDGAGSLFPPARLAQLAGDHPRRHRAEPGKRYALLLDVAGEEEIAPRPASFQADARRDSTALTVVEVEESRSRGVEQFGRAGAGSIEPPPAGDGDRGVDSPRLLDFSTPRLPVYRIVDRMAWTGVRHTALHAQLVDLARNVWRASVVVVDATGVGAGLASFLAATLGERRSGRAIPVAPFVFSAASKSALGWDLLGLIDAGRLKDYRDDGDRLSRLFRAQLAATTYETPPGPGRPLRWSVPAGRGHDDLVMSAALAATLDGFDWRERVAYGTEEGSG
ncbi:MAG TPA: hypothetical protein VFU81_15910, partial [Thermomicrobiales bacterium]|nr:hypothetical protein [Thermomicrobiales bacterium]